MRTHRIITAILVAVSIATLLTAAQPDWFKPPEPEEILVGLEGVHVLIEKFEWDTKRYGLMERVLQDDVERVLRDQGVQVLTYPRRNMTPGKPFLHVTVDAIAEEGVDWINAFMTVQLKEAVYLERMPDIHHPAAVTWERRAVVGSPRSFLEETVRANLKMMVGTFAGEYEWANPHSTRPRIRPRPGSYPPPVEVATGWIRRRVHASGESRWRFVTEANERLSPVNLPAEFCQDGLRIRCIYRRTSPRSSSVELLSISLWSRTEPLPKSAEH